MEEIAWRKVLKVLPVNELHAYIQAVCNATPLVILVVDEHMEIMNVNRATERLVHKEASKLIGCQPGDGLCCIHALSSPFGCGRGEECSHCLIRNTLERVKETGEPFYDLESEHVLVIDGKKSRLWFSISAIPFSLAGKSYVLLAMADITSRKMMEAELFESKKKLEEYSRNLEILVQEKVKEISVSQMATIFAIARLAEARDYETGKHLERMRDYCKLLATWLYHRGLYRENVSENFIRAIYEASPLHDIGKVGVPDAVLLKPGKLTSQEFDVMKQHTVIGAGTLQEVVRKYPQNAFIAMGFEIARWHHERWDGSGYPDGLKGEAIPLSARIMAVADVYDALRSRRPYKNAFSHKESFDLIVQGSGSHFDPLLVEAFVSLEDDFRAVYERCAEK